MELRTQWPLQFCNKQILNMVKPIDFRYITGADLENFSSGGPTSSKKKPITQTQKILNTSYLIVILWIDYV